MNATELAALLSQQDGVISRRQARSAGIGMKDHDIRRMIRRREWATVHPGVYVNHTGPLTWHQRAWAAVLYAAPAALCGASALRAAQGPGHRSADDDRPVHVAVRRRRATLVEPAGVRIHHVSHPHDRVLWNTSPPRLRYEEAALDVAIAATRKLDAIAALAEGCGSRRTTARRMLESLTGRQRVPERAWLEGVLLDIAEGTCSVLEHGHLDLIERPHGVPSAQRQVRATASLGLVYRDAEYGHRLVVELDGRVFHDSSSARDADFERDLDAAVDRRTTVRLSYGQVFDRPCQTAAKLVVVLATHGIEVDAHPCGPGCPVGGLDVAV
ncbi:MAG TPA: type IV toxin-antitoxin system AbiEi family antitoxin domain-containing protein [Marmoricola sp.]|jgi:hypothetical protein|nr:type IV toxin-antitoxin system AbiEi family antitoxin domain-containing protein [Marmoricola sp.]